MAAIPRTLRVVLVVVGVEVLLLVAWAVWSLVALVQGTDAVAGAVFLAVFALAVAAVLAASARALVRGRRTGRSPVVTWQLLQVGVAAALLQAGSWLGWALVVPSVAVVGLMLTRPVVEHTVPDARPRPGAA